MSKFRTWPEEAPKKKKGKIRPWKLRFSRGEARVVIVLGSASTEKTSQAQAEETLKTSIQSNQLKIVANS